MWTDLESLRGAFSDPEANFKHGIIDFFPIFGCLSKFLTSGRMQMFTERLIQSVSIPKIFQMAILTMLLIIFINYKKRLSIEKIN